MAEQIAAAVARVASSFAADRPARQQRRHLSREDFDALAGAGLLRAGLPAERGGLWRDVPGSTREVCEIYRNLARSDSSVALAASMHPAVLAFWLATPEVPAPDSGRWLAQCDEIFGSVDAGHWWGTITSEPGSGGDVTKSITAAKPEGDHWLLSGAKHFGSGSGMTSYMLTTARPDGEDDADWFYLAVEGVPWDGSAGIRLVGEWDGHGMAATQSHAFQFDSVPATRIAWPGHLQDLVAAATPFVASIFTAVVLGIVDVAFDTARAQLEAKRGALRPYEQVEWTKAELEAWLAVQAYEGALRAVESGAPSRGAVLRGKTAVAQLAESSLQRLCRVIGGGTYGRRSPYGHWFEDVRALGFLRPPWGLAYDALFDESFG